MKAPTFFDAWLSTGEWSFGSLWSFRREPGQLIPRPRFYWAFGPFNVSFDFGVLFK